MVGLKTFKPFAALWAVRREKLPSLVKAQATRSSTWEAKFVGIAWMSLITLLGRSNES